MRKRMIFDKRGESLNVPFPTLIFIIGNLIFFLILLIFIYRSSTGALAYEEIYAKEIALALDRAKSGTNISLNFEKGYSISEKNKWGGKDFYDLVNFKNNTIYVKLDKNGGYSMPYFSDVDFKIIFDRPNKQIILVVK